MKGVTMSKNIDDDDVINNFLYMLEDSKKSIAQVKVKKIYLLYRGLMNQKATVYILKS